MFSIVTTRNCGSSTFSHQSVNGWSEIGHPILSPVFSTDWADRRPIVDWGEDVEVVYASLSIGQVSMK